MNYEDVKQYIKELNVTSLKVTDTNGKKLVEFIQAPSPETLINKLDAFSPSLKAQGRVIMLGANDSQYKQNWKECCHWAVTFGSEIVQVNNSTANQLTPGIGYISKTEAELIARNKELEQEIKWNTRLSELEKKIELASTKPKEHWAERLIDKYAPIALPAMGMKFDPDQMDTMQKMYLMQGMANGTVVQQRTNAIAGTNTGTPTIQMTEEEKKQVEELNSEIDKLSEKIPLQKLIAVCKGFNANPGLIDIADSFIKNQKPQ